MGNRNRCHSSTGRELIDTLWNVNLKDLKKNILAAFELIDTLWNVNMISGSRLFATSTN